MMGLHRAAVLAAAALLAACPGLETPLATVTGRIVGASPGAYVYPLGRPDLKVAVGVDGTYRLEGVPTSVGAFVLFDGVAPAGRAELVVQEVDGGKEIRIPDRHGSGATVDPSLLMPLAATLLAEALPDGAATVIGPTFSVLETEHLALVAAPGADAVQLYPLPAGTFDVTAALGGFVSGRVTVLVTAGTTVAVPISLSVDYGAPAPGCSFAPGCDNGLHCNATDGRCYPCTSDPECALGETCATSLGLCQPPAGSGVGAVCAACAGDADCASGACVVPGAGLLGYCTRPGCAGDVDCPAGFACDTADGRCRAPSGCGDWLQTMGSPCLDDSTCSDGLHGGRCEHPAGQPGYCTAPCTTPADCRIGAGTAAALTCTLGFCVR